MPRTTKQVKVELLDGSEIFRPALQAVLTRMGFVVVGGNGRNGNGQADVTVIDLVTHTGTLAELEELVREASRAMPVLVLARGNTPQLNAAFRAGASGCVRSDGGLEQLREAILTVAGGGSFCDRELFQSLMKSLMVMPQMKEHASITPREQQVLACVSGGRTNKEIAQQLGVSEQSVKVYISNLLRKTGALNRSGLASYAITQRVVRLLAIGFCFLQSLPF